MNNKSSLIVLVLLLFVFINSCVTDKIVQQTGVQEIVFGSGGGFTGNETTYTLNPNGELNENNKTLGLSKKLTKETTSHIFILAQELKNYSFNNPDNLYSLIEVKTKDGSNRIVWGFGSTTVSKKVTDLFDQLTSKTK